MLGMELFMILKSAHPSNAELDTLTWKIEELKNIIDLKYVLLDGFRKEKVTEKWELEIKFWIYIFSISWEY